MKKPNLEDPSDLMMQKLPDPYKFRVLVFDTETTGLEKSFPVEIGCIELIDGKITPDPFHFYLRPAATIEPDAQRVHGLSREFLATRGVSLASGIGAFMRFVNEVNGQGYSGKPTVLVAHKASFDVDVINRSLEWIGSTHGRIEWTDVFDTLSYMRKKYPGRMTLKHMAILLKVDAATVQGDFHTSLFDATLTAKCLQALWRMNLF